MNSPKIYRFEPYMSPVDLEERVYAIMIGFGFNPTEEELSAEGGIETADRDDDHWMNLREY